MEREMGICFLPGTLSSVAAFSQFCHDDHESGHPHTREDKAPPQFTLLRRFLRICAEELGKTDEEDAAGASVVATARCVAMVIPNDPPTLKSLPRPPLQINTNANTFALISKLTFTNHSIKILRARSISLEVASEVAHSLTKTAMALLALRPAQ